MQKITSSNGGITEHRFENGFKVILAPYPQAGKCLVKMVVRVGSKHEQPHEYGFAHFLEHMLFKSTKNFGDVKQYLAKYASDKNANTSVDRTVYFSVVEPQHVKNMVAFEFDRLFNASFTETEFQTEKDVVSNEIEQSLSKPQYLMLRDVLAQRYRNHGYGHTTLGETSHVKNASMDQLMAFYKRFYQSSNAYLIVSGTFDEADVLRTVDEWLQKEPEALESTYQFPTILPQRGYARTTLHTEYSRTILKMNWTTPGGYSKTALALQIAWRAMWSKTRNSLYTDLVKDRNVCIDIGSGTWAKKDYLDLFLDIHVEKDTDAAIEEVKRTLYNYVRQGLGENDWRQALDQLKSQLSHQTREWSELPELLEDCETAHDWKLMFTGLRELEQMPIEYVNSVLQKWLKEEYLIESMLVPTVLDAFEHDISHVDWSHDEYPSIIPNADAPLVNFASAPCSRVDGSTDVRILGVDRKFTDGLVHINFTNRRGSPEDRWKYRLAAYVTGLRSEGGSSYNASTLNQYLNVNQVTMEWSYTGFSLSCPPDKVEHVFLTLLDIFLNPNIPENAWVAMKQKQLQLIKQNALKASSIAGLWLKEMSSIYPSNTVEGYHSLDDIADLFEHATFENVQQSLKWMSILDDVTVTYDGEVSSETLQKWITALNVHKDENTTYIPTTPIGYSLEENKRHIVEMGDDPNAFVEGLYYFNYPIDSYNFRCLRLATMIFGNPFSSRLWDTIREEKGYAYSVAARLKPHIEAPYTALSMMSSCPSEKAFIVENEMRQLWNHFITHGVSEKELFDAKENLDKEYQQILSASLENRLLFQEHYGFSLEGIDRRHADIMNISLEQLNTFIRTELQHAKNVWAIAKSK